MLNYVYAILEAETRIALLTVGLDPAIGILHADQANRDSLALDVMEAVRPTVDRWLLDLLADNQFAKRDFFEQRDGTVRVSSNVTAILAETAPMWAREIAPLAEWIAKQLVGEHDGNEIRLPTPLTEANRSEGRDEYRKRDSGRSETTIEVRLKTCPICGQIHKSSSREFCSDECLKVYKQEIVTPRFAEAGITRLQELREQGTDPAHGGTAAEKRARSNVRRANQRADWEAEHPDLDIDQEKERFTEEILPTLKEFPLSKISKATGLSTRYCSLIRRGEYVPHPVHYQALEDLRLSL